MSTQLTADHARQSLTSHVAAKGLELYQKYGPTIGWAELLRIVEDHAFVRYPCEIVFDAKPLLSGEFAHPSMKANRPEDGFIMHVHPHFFAHLDRVPWLVLYQLVALNYGEFASSDDAEMFGAAALGLTRDQYYEGLCKMADEVTIPG
jgi:hypothetical protein